MMYNMEQKLELKIGQKLWCSNGGYIIFQGLINYKLRFERYLVGDVEFMEMIKFYYIECDMTFESAQTSAIPPFSTTISVPVSSTVKLNLIDLIKPE